MERFFVFLALFSVLLVSGCTGGPGDAPVSTTSSTSSTTSTSSTSTTTTTLAHFEAGVAFYEAHDFGAALSEADAALYEDPWSLRNRLFKGDVLHQLGRCDEALEYLTVEALTEYGRSGLWYGRASCLFALENYSGAAEAYDLFSVGCGPDCGLPYTWTANAYFLDGNYTEARAWIDRIELSFFDSESEFIPRWNVLRLKADVYAKTGNCSEAVALYEDVMVLLDYDFNYTWQGSNVGLSVFNNYCFCRQELKEILYRDDCRVFDEKRNETWVNSGGEPVRM